MELLVAYDRWCEGRVRALLLFLEELFSISQKHAERGMIAFYLVLVASPPYRTKMSFPIQMCGACLVASLMWVQHRRPEALRERARLDPTVYACARIIIQFLFGSLFVFDLVSPDRAIAAAASQAVYLIFYYMIDITSNGERGRRRKLAWAKIKELFGTEWMPKPAMAPQ